MSYEHILYQVEGPIATLTLNRPERLNALTPLMREEIYEAIAQAEESNDVRAVIITGAGKGFCSGGDVKAMQENIKNRQGNPLDERITPMRDKVVLAMRETSKPLIAAINGAAAGGGLGLAGTGVRGPVAALRALPGLGARWGVDVNHQFSKCSSFGSSDNNYRPGAPVVGCDAVGLAPVVVRRSLRLPPQISERHC